MTPPLWQKVKRNKRASWWRWKRRVKGWFFHSIFKKQRSSLIISWEIKWEKIETVTDFILQGSKVTVDGDCSHEIKRCLLLGRKAMTILDTVLKRRDITLPTKLCIFKALVFPVVTYGCECWTIKKTECQRIDAFEMWCWRREFIGQRRVKTSQW